MFLVDTNIFLEILLGQDKKEVCKRFLDKNIGNLNITDFSLHSLGDISGKLKMNMGVFDDHCSKKQDRKGIYSTS